MALPKDPFILLSFINTKLRDEFDSLEKFCESENESKKKIENTLKQIGFSYDSDKNTFNQYQIFIIFLVYIVKQKLKD